MLTRKGIIHPLEPRVAKCHLLANKLALRPTDSLQNTTATQKTMKKSNRIKKLNAKKKVVYLYFVFVRPVINSINVRSNSDIYFT